MVFSFSFLLLLHHFKALNVSILGLFDFELLVIMHSISVLKKDENFHYI